MDTIGEHSYGAIGNVGQGNITIGKFCSIAGNVNAFFLQDHRTDWISTYPFNVLWGYSEIQGHPINPNPDLNIGNDVWIGTNVMFLNGLNVGDGAVIGAFSVVVKDIEPYNIVVGNPATPIKNADGTVKKKFNDNQIVALLEIKWWNWGEEKIKEEVPLLCSGNVDEFIAKHLGD